MTTFSLKMAKTFKIEVGTPIFFGKYLNKKGLIKEFKENEKGDTIIVVEPVPKGRKQDRDLKLFRIRPRSVEKKASRVRPVVAKLVEAGWWAIKPGSPGINPPPVDKGGLMNALPGVDPAEAARYNGDGPADKMGAILDDIDLAYRQAWGRPAYPEELEAVFQFVFRPVREDHDFGKQPQEGYDSWPLNQWVEGTAKLVGVTPETVMQLPWDTLKKLNQWDRDFHNESIPYGPSPSQKATAEKEEKARKKWEKRVRTVIEVKVKKAGIFEPPPVMLSEVGDWMIKTYCGHILEGVLVDIERTRDALGPVKRAATAMEAAIRELDKIDSFAIGKFVKFDAFDMVWGDEIEVRKHIIGVKRVDPTKLKKPRFGWYRDLPPDPSKVWYTIGYGKKSISWKPKDFGHYSWGYGPWSAEDIRKYLGRRLSSMLRELTKVLNDPSKIQPVDMPTLVELELLRHECEKHSTKPKSYTGKAKKKFNVDLTGWKYVTDIDGAKKTLKDAGWGKISVELDFKGTQYKGGHWNGTTHALNVEIGSGTTSRYIRTPEQARTLNALHYGMMEILRTCRHELQHVGQDLLRDIKGLTEDAGLPGRSVRNPMFDQRGISVDPNEEGKKFYKVHPLRDVEFYTNLADEIDRFVRYSRKIPLEDRAKAIRIWVGAGDDKMVDAKGDTLSAVQQFFYSLKMYEKPKWRKAVAEFVKGVTDRIKVPRDALKSRMGAKVKKAADIGWIRDEDSGETFWGKAGAGVAFVTDDGRILLLKRSPSVDQGGTWGIPGGALQAGETDPWKAAVQEVKEETGLSVQGKRRGKYVFKKGKFTFTTFIIEVTADVADRMRPRLDWENTDWGWFDMQSIQGIRLHFGVKSLLSVHGDVLKAASSKTAARRPNVQTWYHGGKIRGGLKPMYLTPSEALASIHGEIHEFTIRPSAGWFDTSTPMTGFWPGMDSIGSEPGYWSDLRKRGADVVWDESDFKRGYEQVFVVNPAVLKRVTG